MKKPPNAPTQLINEKTRIIAPQVTCWDGFDLSWVARVDNDRSENDTEKSVQSSDATDKESEDSTDSCDEEANKYDEYSAYERQHVSCRGIILL